LLLVEAKTPINSAPAVALLLEFRILEENRCHAKLGGAPIIQVEFIGSRALKKSSEEFARVKSVVS